MCNLDVITRAAPFARADLLDELAAALTGNQVEIDPILGHGATQSSGR